MKRCLRRFGGQQAPSLNAYYVCWSDRRQVLTHRIDLGWRFACLFLVSTSFTTNRKGANTWCFVILYSALASLAHV